MDKNTVLHVEKESLLPRRCSLPRGVRWTSMDRRFGLKIFKYGREAMGSAREPSGSLRYFEFYGFSHLIRGRGWFFSEDSGKLEEFEPGCGVMTCPGFVHDYAGLNSEYVEDSIVFAGPLADTLADAGIISSGIVDVGRERRLLPVIELAMDPAPRSQLAANIELQSFLLDIFRKNALRRHSDENSSSIDVLVNEIKRNPARWWTLPEMASFCNLSKNQFRRVFRERTGINPKKYVDEIKITHAAGMLCSSDATVADVAESFSYSDPFHFSRRFKEITGLSPENYRKRFSLKQ